MTISDFFKENPIPEDLEEEPTEDEKQRIRQLLDMYYELHSKSTLTPKELEKLEYIVECLEFYLP